MNAPAPITQSTADLLREMRAAQPQVSDPDDAVDRERKRCARIARGAAHLPNNGHAFANGWCSAAIQIAQAIEFNTAPSVPTPAVASTPDIDASEVAPSPLDLYEITHAHQHPTLKAGDRVRMLVDAFGNNVLLRVDYTFHTLQDKAQQYVHLCKV